MMALMVGAMIIHGIQPGPQVMTANPELFWGMIASMWVGNLMLVVLNLPLIGLWVRLLHDAATDYLFPAILLFCCDRRVHDQQQRPSTCCIAAFFGFLGYVFIKLEVRAGAAAARLRARAR